MFKKSSASVFNAQILRPKLYRGESQWAFIILPKAASDKLPRRGRTSVDGVINGVVFQVLLEPDGKKSHWLPINKSLFSKAGLNFGDTVELEIKAVEQEPEPDEPLDFSKAVSENLDAKTTWQATTTLARLDWIHWVTSAKQEKTRSKRILDACQMLAEGKKRVCCFDPSGFYSKAIKAPEAED